MKIYLARHGRTNYNDLDLCNDDPAVDVHLTQTGLKQAEALAERLKVTPIDHIIVSELKRSKQTADIINKFHSTPITIDPRINFPRPYGRGIHGFKPIPIGLPNGSFIPRPDGRGILRQH